MSSIKRGYFNKTNIRNGLIIAILLSLIPYLEYFSISNKYLNSLLGLLAIYTLLNLKKRADYFYTGFFVGIMWFYWISFSLVYYKLEFLIPFEILGLGIIYGFLFFICGFFSNVFYKAFAFLVLSSFGPFGFDWFKFEVLFANSVFNIHKIYIILLVFIIASLIFLRNNKNINYIKTMSLVLILCLGFCINFTAQKKINTKLKIYLPSYHISQTLRWKASFLEKSKQINYENIEEAIKKHYDLVILPETAFSIILNASTEDMLKLKQFSKKINIITGALSEKNGKFYNSLYLFSKGQVKIANKVVLVPFGEEVPLPKFAKDFINKIFFDGASDYASAKKPSTFKIKDTSFRVAICYEATNKILYQNLKNTKHFIALSNDAWFTPSIMPTLQRLLLLYYAKRYDIKIFHEINGSKSYILNP